MQAIVFDFDGVILESVEIKARAFQKLFKDYPQYLGQILKLHLDNAGVSRFEKFEIIYRDYLGRAIDKREMEQLGQQFSQLIYEEILCCPFVPGAYQFLTKYCTRYDLFVASGTPENEIRHIVEQRNLARFFRRIYGSPRSKGEILRAILGQYQFNPVESVFIGDAVADYSAAREASVPFIGRVPKGESNPFPDSGAIAVVEDLEQLDQQWDSVIAALCV